MTIKPLVLASILDGCTTRRFRHLKADRRSIHRNIFSSLREMAHRDKAGLLDKI